MKLSTRVTLAMTVVTGIALLASFLAVGVLVSQDEDEDMDQALTSQARAFAGRALTRSPEQPTVHDGLTAVPEGLAAVPRYIVIYDEQGAPVSFSKNFNRAPPRLAGLGIELPIDTAGESVDLSVAGARLRGVVVPFGPDSRRAMLYAAARSSIDQDLRFLRHIESVIFVTAIVLTSLIAYWLSARISRDVATIASVARAVADGDLAARVGKAALGSTETRALAGNMDHMIQQLQALVVGQRTFVSHAAHELRSPLSTIRGELQLALRRQRLPGEYCTAIETALADVQTMSSLTDDLLVLAAAQNSTRTAHQVGPVTVRALIDEALRLSRGLISERRVAVEVSADDDDVMTAQVAGPLGDVARAFRNLVDNALAHSAEGERVEIRAACGPTEVAIRVVDHGDGILPHESEHIFQPFFRGSKEQAGERAGAGLGLAIAREIARARRGDVNLIDSTAGAGCVFELRLAKFNPPLAT